MNLSDEVFEIKQGDRIAQAVFSKIEKVIWDEGKDLNNTERGQGGFGHTGK
jgi:dUTP pyrophosphatase